MRPLVLIVCACLPACLSSPEGLTQPPAIGAWPPPGVALDVGAARVIDLDRDGIDDLVLASRAPEAPALYVLLGGPDGVGARLHAQVVPSVPPLALDVADVSGDGLDDLVAFGGDMTQQLIEAFPATAVTEFGAPWRKESHALPTVEPLLATLEVVDFEPDGIADLVLADQLHVEIGRMPAATEVGFVDMMIEALPAGLDFGQPASAFLAVDDGGRRDLVVVSGLRTTVYRQIGEPPPTSPDQIANSDGFSVHARCDLDGDGTVEVIGGHGGWDAITPSSLAELFRYDDRPAFGVPGEVPAGWCGQLDHDAAGRPDLAVLERSDGSGVVVHVLPDLWLQPSPPALRTSRSERLESPLIAGDAVVMVAGDFDGDDALELLVVARDGAISCLVVGTDAIAPCAP